MPAAPAMALAVSTNSGHFAASAADQLARSWAERAVSRHNTRALPDGVGAKTLTGGAMVVRPRPARPKILADLRVDGHRVRQGRQLKARRDSGVDRTAAHDTRRLEHDDPPARARQIRGRDQAVVAASDNDDVVARHYDLPPFSTASAAFRPGAPMMPPPGCVADPHIQDRRIGVR